MVILFCLFTNIEIGARKFYFAVSYDGNYYKGEIEYNSGAKFEGNFKNDIPYGNFKYYIHNGFLFKDITYNNIGDLNG